MLPLPVLAATDKLVNEPFKQVDCAEIEGCAVIDGNALTIILPDIIDWVVQLSELVIIAK